MAAGGVSAASGGGLAGEHDSQSTPSILAGTSTSDEFNHVRLGLNPIACWRVESVRFAFDSSFINYDPDNPENPNDIRTELAHLIALIQAHPGCPLSVFGHADPVGRDDYNKALSGRRAMSVYALLTAQTDPGGAASLWQTIASTENWGTDQRGQMESFTGLPSGTSDSTLFKAYLQKLCPAELQLAKTDFLAQGADSCGKGDYQGCSEFNPTLIFSQEKQAQYDQAKQNNDADGIAARDADNAPNRRVLVLMFRKGSRVDPAKWPCPRATDPMAGCLKRFWSDGQTRRSKQLSGADRRFSSTADTFACRFYQRLVTSSPCEDPPVLAKMRVRVLVNEIPIANEPYTLRIDDGDWENGSTNADGLIQHLLLPDAKMAYVRFTKRKQDLQIQLGPIDPVTTTTGLQTRLKQMGFYNGTVDGEEGPLTRSAVEGFQQSRGMPVTGVSTDIQDALAQAYGS